MANELWGECNELSIRQTDECFRVSSFFSSITTISQTNGEAAPPQPGPLVSSAKWTTPKAERLLPSRHDCWGERWMYPWRANYLELRATHKNLEALLGGYCSHKLNEKYFYAHFHCYKSGWVDVEWMPREHYKNAWRILVSDFSLLAPPRRRCRH